MGKSTKPKVVIHGGATLEDLAEILKVSKQIAQLPLQKRHEQIKPTIVAYPNGLVDSQTIILDPTDPRKTSPVYYISYGIDKTRNYAAEEVANLRRDRAPRIAGKGIWE